MNEFFSPEETGNNATLSKYIGCGGCGLYKQSRYPKQEVTGQGNKGILIIGKYPFVGEFDFSHFLNKKGISVEKDCWWINSINCEPPNPRELTLNEINMCRPKVWNTIKNKKPKLIFLLGTSPVISFLGDRINNIGNIHKWVNWFIPDRKAKTWVCPIFNPEYVYEENQSLVVEKIWIHNIEKALKYLQIPFPNYKREQDQVQILNNSKHLETTLKRILIKEKPIAIDFETSGKKPYAPNHFIKSCSISINSKSAYSFLLPEKGTKSYELLIEIIENPLIHKYIHNAKFEIIWAYVILKAIFKGVTWDSQLASHILSNRPGIKSLKFQTYIHFGIIDYSSSINAYLKGKDKDGGNGFNTINQAPITQLLTYNGCDTIFGYRLAELQMGLLGVTL